MSNQKLLSISFCISDNWTKYRLANLKFNPEKEEICYHFAHLRDKKKAHTLYNNSKEIIETWVPDHISFHKDGTVHTTHKEYLSNKYRFNHHKLDDNIFYSATDYGIFPLLMESFYFNDIEKQFPSFTKHQNEEIVLEYPSTIPNNKISICLFICRSVDASNGIKIQNEFGKTILMPPDHKQLDMWFTWLNLYNFSLPNQKFTQFELSNGWWIIPIFSHYVNKKVVKNSNLEEYISYWIFPPKDIFVNGNFGSIFEI